MSEELTAIQSLYANYESKAVTLSPSSVAVLFYALERIKPIYAWSNGATDTITQSDQDEIEKIVDLAFYEVMSELIIPDNLYIGEIRMIATDTLPSKWLPCSGLAINRTTYSALFAAIGTLYGAGNGSTTFNIPNLSNRFPKMYNPVATPGTEEAMAGIGGAKTVTLDTTQIPSHTHTGVVSANNPVSNRALVSSGGAQTVLPAGTSNATGGGLSHENRPPFLSIDFMIYTGVA